MSDMREITVSAGWDDCRILNEAAQLIREGRALSAEWVTYFDHLSERLADALRRDDDAREWGHDAASYDPTE